MRNAFIDHLSLIMESDDSIILLTADLGYGVFEEIEQKFPSQFFNVGVSEQNMIGIAAGLALSGSKVIVYSIGVFPTFRCLEQIRNDVCYHNLPVLIVGMGAGLSYGALGMSHHATEDISIIRSLPNISVLSPCSKIDVTWALDYFVNIQKPCYLRLDKTYVDSSKITNSNTNISDALVRYFLGSKIALITTGGISDLVINVANHINIETDIASVYCLSALKPINSTIVEHFKSHDYRYIFTIEEHNLPGGLGSMLLEIFNDNDIPFNKINRIGLNDHYASKVGSQAYLREQYQLDEHAIYSYINEIINL